MTVETVIATLFTAYKKTVDDEAVALYTRGLAGISIQLLDAASGRAIRTRVFVPTVAELRTDAEAERQAFLQAHPFVSCTVCRDSEGWVAFTDDDGIARVRRCGCVARYHASLARIGITGPILALPAPSEVTS